MSGQPIRTDDASRTILDAPAILERILTGMRLQLPPDIDTAYLESFKARNRDILLARLRSQLPPPAFHVVDRTRWVVHRGGSNNPLGGLEGALTALDVDGVGRCYVRENLDLNHFLMTSNQRLAMKQGRKPKHAREVLDLVAPAWAWEAVAELVHAHDALRRPVRRHPQFTVAWAEEQFRRHSVVRYGTDLDPTAKETGTDCSLAAKETSTDCSLAAGRTGSESASAAKGTGKEAGPEERTSSEATTTVEKILATVVHSLIDARVLGLEPTYIQPFLSRHRFALQKSLEAYAEQNPDGCIACRALARAGDVAVLQESFETPMSGGEGELLWEVGDLCAVLPASPHAEVRHPRHDLGRVRLCTALERRTIRLVRGRRPVIALIGCSASKAADSMPARNLYRGELFRLSRTWAERHTDAWAILSAEHGVLMPDKVIQPYDKRLPTRLDAIEAWLQGVSWELYAKWRSAHLIVLAGAAYRVALEQGNWSKTLSWEAPLAGLEIGQQLRALKRAVEGIEPLNLRGAP